MESDATHLRHTVLMEVARDKRIDINFALDAKVVERSAA